MNSVCRFILPLVTLTVSALTVQPAGAGVAEPVSAVGPHRLLVVAVRFPKTEPTQTLDQIRDKIGRVDRYVRSASYGKAWLEPNLVGWYDMPAPLGDYSVSAENAHVGHVVHDLLHALGGASGGNRAVPDLYDYELQSNPRSWPMLPEHFAIHAGPWDIMSQHWIERTLPPPAPSAFTRLQLGWIGADRIVTVRAGETREIMLQPLSSGTGLLAARIPLDKWRYLLIENRQRVGSDRMLPAAGLLVLEVDTAREEGTAILRVADANPSVSRLYGVPFIPGAGERRAYQNTRAGVAIAPLAVDPDGTMRLVITTPERIRDFVRDSAN